MSHPEPTPIGEAQALATDLLRAGITPYAWIVNACLSLSHPTNDLLVARASEELESLKLLHTDHLYALPYLPNLEDTLEPMVEHLTPAKRQ